MTGLGSDLVAQSSHVSKAASEAQAAFRPTVRLKAMLRNLMDLMEQQPAGSEELVQYVEHIRQLRLTGEIAASPKKGAAADDDGSVGGGGGDASVEDVARKLFAVLDRDSDGQLTRWGWGGALWFAPARVRGLS